MPNISKKDLTGFQKTMLPRGSACLQCKEKKKRCDATKPACRTCTKLGRASECSYPQRKTTHPYGKVFELERIPPPEPLAEEELTDKKQRALVARGNRLGKELSLIDQNSDWWAERDIPVPLSNFLINTFLKHAQQVHYEDLTPVLLNRFHSYAPSHPSHPHPSLLNAVYLISSFYLSSPAHPSAKLKESVKWNTDRIEATFLRRAKEIQRDVQGDHILDCLLATGLVAKYLFLINRHVEAYNETSMAMRLALQCNLHKISSPYFKDYPVSPTSRLSMPKSDEDVRDRINAFWSAYFANRGGSIINGCGITVSDENIATIFSRPLSERMTTSSTREDNLMSLRQPSSPALDTSHDTILINKVKWVAMFDRVRLLIVRAAQIGAKSISELPPTLASEFHTLDFSLSKLVTSLPVIPTIVSEHKDKKVDLSNLHQITRAIVIRLHAFFSMNDEWSRERCLRYAKEMVNVARTVEEALDVYWQVPINMAWANSCEVFQLEIRRIINSHESLSQVTEEEKGKLQDLRDDMLYIENLTARFIKTHRFNQPSLLFVQELLLRDAPDLDQIFNPSPSLLSTSASPAGSSSFFRSPVTGFLTISDLTPPLFRRPGEIPNSFAAPLSYTATPPPIRSPNFSDWVTPDSLYV